MTKPIMTDELREKKRQAGLLGAAKTNALKAEKKAAGEYDQRTKLERNLAFNQQLDIDIAALRAHCKTLPQFVEGTTEPIDYDTWIDSASSILRDSTWNKTYDEDQHRDYEVPYQDRPYFDFPYPDFAASELLITYTHLPLELRNFLAKALDSFIQWSTSHPEQKLEDLPRIKAGLQRLLEGKDFYNEATIQGIHERLELEETRIQHEAEEAERIRNIKYDPALAFVPAPPPPPIDPLVAAEQLAKLQAYEQARVEEDNRLRQMNPDAWNYLRGGR